MLLKAEGTVTGYTQFSGAIDGQNVESNTVFVEVSIGSMGKGTRSVGRKCVDAAVIQKIAHLPLPFLAEMVMEEVATRNKETTVIMEIRPLKAVQKVA